MGSMYLSERQRLKSIKSVHVIFSISWLYNTIIQPSTIDSHSYIPSDRALLLSLAS